MYVSPSVRRALISRQFIGGKNWHPEPIKEYLVGGDTGRFLAIWSTLSMSDSYLDPTPPV